MTHIQETKEMVESNDRLQNLTLDLVNKSGLSWTIEKEPLVSPTGRITDNYGLFRSDNGYCVGIHKKRYVHCDNYELANLLVYASSSIQDLSVENAKGGLFKGGSKVYMQIPLPSVQVGNAQVTRHLTALNSHDGSTSIALGTTQTVVSCQNTFYKAYRSQDMERVIHSKNMKDRLNSISKVLEMTIANDMQTIEIFRKMAQTSSTPIIVEELKHLVFNVDSSQEDLELSTRKTNLMAKFDKSISVEYGEQGDNLWGLFNAVTRYTNHEMKANYKTNNNLENVMIGQGARINQVAYNYLSQFTN
jgi:phage/plasmid-like protein (TIGR03299 family)